MKTSYVMLFMSLIFIPINGVSESKENDFFLATSWKNTSFVDDRSCVLEARKVLEFSKFTEKLDHTSSKNEDGSFSAWGQRTEKQGVYKAVIKCVSEVNAVFFVVSGSDAKITRTLVDVLSNNFREEVAQ